MHRNRCQAKETDRAVPGTVAGWPIAFLTAVLLLGAGLTYAQTPVDEDGNPVGDVIAGDDEFETPVEPLSADELQTLVGPVALYPDDLLAIVLPASTYPLQIVQAARFLDERGADAGEPPEAWDDSVVALLNYPEVLRMMSEDIDWTWRLGEAVVAQQADVVAAVETFRDRAYAAGNLQSDERQTVTRNDDVIEIDPAEDDVIYVPYYEPAEVVIRQPRRVYYYYPDPYPVYYYPYPAGHHFAHGYFWGVTTAFRIGWLTDHLHVHHHSFHGHPFFGRHYYGHYWRRPSITVFNTWYGHYADRGYRHRYGSYWRPRRHGGARPGYHHARDRYYTQRRRSSSDDGYARERRHDRERRGADRAARTVGEGRAARNRRDLEGRNSSLPRREADPIRFRARDANGNRRDSRDSRRANRREDQQAARTTRRTGASERRDNRASTPPSRRGDAANRANVDRLERRRDRLQNERGTRPSVRRGTVQRPDAGVTTRREPTSRPAVPQRRAAPSRERLRSPSRSSGRTAAPSRPASRPAPARRDSRPAPSRRDSRQAPSRSSQGGTRGSAGERRGNNQRGDRRRQRERR